MADHSINGKVATIAGGAKNLGARPGREGRPRGGDPLQKCNGAASKAEAEAAVALQGDLTTAAVMEKLFADADAAVGRPNIAIHTVGKVLKMPFTEISEAEYDEMTAVNTKTAFFLLREAGRHMNNNGGGHLIWNARFTAGPRAHSASCHLIVLDLFSIMNTLKTQKPRFWRPNHIYEN